MNGVKKILLVSNGHAEDLAAAEIGKWIIKSGIKAEISAVAMIGLGKAYDKENIPDLGPKTILPSGGFAKEGFRYLIRDLFAGLPRLFFRQISILRRASRDSDLIVAVGDAFLVALCGFFTGKPLIFIDGPKSIKIAGYWPIELWLMKKFCKEVVVQDKETADYLVSRRLPAQYLGSWVMDYIPISGDDFGIEPAKTVIGILPGTREEAYENLNLILEVLEEMGKIANDNFIGLIASTLDTEKIKATISKTSWKLDGNYIVLNNGIKALISKGKFGDVCLRSKLIIGLAGIANEQAVAFGKPVVCFVGSGAQTTLRRWQEIQSITGRSMEIVSGSAKEKAEQIIEILHSPAKIDEMIKIGKNSKPEWGGTKNIALLIKDTIAAASRGNK